MNKQKGFTIIELIVVIAIIAVLAAVVLVNVTGYIQKARDSAAIADLRQLKTLATDYYVTNSTFNGFCSSTQAQNIGEAIKSAQSAYTYYCYDGTSGYTAEAPSLIPSAYATVINTGNSACLNNGAYIAYAYKSSGTQKYICAGGSTSGLGSYDFFGSLDNFPNTSNCSCK